MIRDAARDTLEKVSDSAAVRVAINSERGFDTNVWQTLSGELGWCGVAIGEQHGGLGLGPVELALIQEQAGYRLLCAPFFSTVCLAANVLQNVGNNAAKEAYLGQIAAGELKATAQMPSAADDWQNTQITANKQGDGWLLSGVSTQVPEAASSDIMFLWAQTDDGIGLFSVGRDTQGLEIETLAGWDATRRFARVTCGRSAAIRCDDAIHSLVNRTRAAALTRIYIAAEQMGAAQRCLDLSVDYVSERKQFGRVIAGFQAVKHRCAQMMVQVEALRSAVYGTAALAASESDTEVLALEGAMVKALASETLFFCAAEAIQLHGGVGFTWEYDPQLYFKRAQASKHWMGEPTALRARIAGGLL